MIESSGEDSHVYSMKHSKRKLLYLYVDHVFFAQMSGCRNIDYLCNFADYMLNEKWYGDKESQRRNRKKVSSAAKIIHAEIREHSYNNDTYTKSEDIYNQDLGK